MTITNDFLAPNGSRFTVRRTAVAATVQPQELLAVNTGGLVAVALPAPGNAGICCAVGDDASNAAANNIVITPAAGTIDGAGSFTIATNDDVQVFVDDGTQWTRVLRTEAAFDAVRKTNVLYTRSSAAGGGAATAAGVAGDIQMHARVGTGLAADDNFNYNTDIEAFRAGTGCTATGQNSVAFGNASQATQANAFASGNQCQATGTEACALGHFSVASGDNAFSCGSSTASGIKSVAMGEAVASNLGAVAIGRVVAASAQSSAAFGDGASATRFGEFVHSSQQLQHAGTEGKHEIDLRAQATSATVNMTDGVGTELTLENQKSYAGTIRLITSDQTGQANGAGLYFLRAHATGGALIVDDVVVLHENLPVGQVFAVSAAGLILRLAFTEGHGDNVIASARVSWGALPGF